MTLFSPGDGDTNVSVMTLIQAGFSEPVLGTQQGMTVLYGPAPGEPVAGTVTYDPSLRVATFTPTAPLVGTNVHTVSLSSVITDESGNALMPISWTFVTSSDGVAPTVLMTTPANDSTNVPVSSTISVTFSEPVSFFNAASVAVSVASVPVTGTFSMAGPRTMVFTPDANLPAASTVDVSLSSGIRDYSNFPLTPFSFSFSTQ
ncbi:MAG: Ig-like domain-containing protein [Kofleriaceae bacterium]|nr:Ig-like domain-containing protein [Kofleriaceae bacterium]